MLSAPRGSGLIHRSLRSAGPKLPLLILAAALWAPAAGAQLPQYDGEVHGGVKTCVGAPCHGHTAATQEVVRLNEGRVWRRDDLHSRAYDVLFNARSVRMAKNLGLDQPAHQAKVCLDCHADYVARDKRGRQFTLEEGVGCEACHGGAGRWVKSHASGTSHSANLSRGMYPTDDPVARAELCLSCHFGNKEKFVDHELMGAGHPRQSFELHVFTQIMPAHYRIDSDYTRRGKQAPAGVKVWTIGQAVAVKHMLDVLLDPEMSSHGVWPEFVLFDCHACHHRMSEDRWRPRPSVGLGPGLARINDSSFLMLRHVLQLIDPARAAQLQTDVKALHQATSRGIGDAREIAQRLRALLPALIDELKAWNVDSAAIQKLARSIVDEGLTGEYIDYAGAEQSAMALQVLVDAMYGFSTYDKATLAKIGAEVPKLLEATKEPEVYAPDTYLASLKRLDKAI